MASRQVRDHRRNEEGADPPRPTGAQHVNLLRQRGDPADPAGEVDADLVAVCVRDLEFRGSQRLLSGGNCKMDETIRPANLFAIHIVGRIEAPDLASEPSIEAGRIEERDRSNAAAGLHNALPERWYIQP